MDNIKDLSLKEVIVDVKPDEKYNYENRLWQGIPTIEITKNGRICVSYYSGGTDEGPDNFILFCVSDDNGKTWINPSAVIDPPDKVRAFDPCLWIDPMDRLWLFWSQSYELFDGRAGVWCSVCDNPESNEIVWSLPRRIANGVMMNKPTVLSDGTWCLPCAIWNFTEKDKKPRLPLEELKSEGFSNVIVSEDNGKTFKLRGQADVKDRGFDEHMIVERNDKSLWMLVRTSYGIGESTSVDKGAIWTEGEPTDLGGPNSRFFIRRLNSGKLILVNHYNFEGRNNLTAMLSDDDGKTWKGNLLLDEREKVSYPDGVQTQDENIYIIYDRDRKGAKEILYACITEEDILQGKLTSESSRLKQVII